MKQIIKIQEPNSLAQYRANAHSFFENLPVETKCDLRKSLLKEQGHICCYCMKRIPEKVEKDGRSSYNMKIEHFLCQDKHPELQLTYTNLLGACTGNEGKPKKLQTCDTKKGKQSLSINPTLMFPNCETLFKYNAEGEISSINNDEEINRLLTDVLNLNMQSLKDNRREVYLEVQHKIETESKQFPDKRLKLNFLEQEKTNWITRRQDKNRPYCMVAIYYLTKKIRKT
jgi:uncharacterized protein (TIGR02646 family)